MTGVEWYYARGGKQVGPISAVELKQKALSGEIRPDDLIWKEGLAEWTAARNVRGLFDDETHPAPGAPPAFTAKADDGPAAKSAPSGDKSLAAAAASITPTTSRLAGADAKPGAHPFDRLLAAVRKTFSARAVELLSERFIAWGHLFLIVAAVLCALDGTLAWVKTDQGIRSFGFGVGRALMFLGLQFVAYKLFRALTDIVHSTEEEIASSFLLDGLALINVVAGIVALIFCVASMQAGTPVFVFLGIAAFIVCEFAAIVAVHPEASNIKIVEKNGVGEEAVSLFASLLKISSRLAPAVYCAGAAFGALTFGFASVKYFSADGRFVAVAASALGVVTTYYAALAPLVAYLAYLFGYLLVDLCRAILAKKRAEK